MVTRPMSICRPSQMSTGHRAPFVHFEMDLSYICPYECLEVCEIKITKQLSAERSQKHNIQASNSHVGLNIAYEEKFLKVSKTTPYESLSMWCLLVINLLVKRKWAEVMVLG